jgi:hypothetical protein
MVPFYTNNNLSFFHLSFTNLPLSNTLKVIYLTVAYIIGHVSLNFAFNAHIGFISVLTKDAVKDCVFLSEISSLEWQARFFSAWEL